LTPIAKDGICPSCGRRFEAVGQTFPEIEAKARAAVAEHLLDVHELIED